MDSSLLLDALYCSEENWEEGLREESDSYILEEPEVVFPVLLEQDMAWEDSEFSDLLMKQEENQNQLLYGCIRSDKYLAAARREAVEWMMKVIGHYSFSALTAVLAVNYLDRFLLSFQFQKDKPWMTQLTAVACLSLAAKVEETQVPLLLDLQVEETRYVFEAKTIQRMEILILSKLKWKMNPVTPVSFLDYFARRLGLDNNHCWEFLRKCDHILFSIISDSRFMCYSPSEMAIATMLHVLDCVELDLVFGNHGIDKDKVDECFKLIIESVRDRTTQSNKRKFGSTTPESPTGVMDVSFSFNCDSSCDSWSFTSSVPSSPEPLSKKGRMELLKF